MTLKVEQDEFVGDWLVVDDLGRHVVERFDTHQEALFYMHKNEMQGTRFAELERRIEAVNEEMLRLSDEAAKLAGMLNG